MKVGWQQIVARRLERHFLLATTGSGQIEDVVRTMCGAHAQVMSAVELSIGLRMSDVTRSDIRQALWTNHTLIKTYGPRGTVHLLPADDLSMWIGALAAADGGSVMPPSIRMTREQVNEVVAAIDPALMDAELTVDELDAAVVARTGAWAGELVMPAFNSMWPRWRQAMHVAAHRGAIVFGPQRGRKVTYTNPRRWIPEFEPEDGARAGTWLLQRYLYGYGPTTPRHFAQWLSIPLERARGIFSTARDLLEAIETDDGEAWINAGDTMFPDEPPQGLHLLPYFDAFVVGFHPRSRLFPGRAAERALAGGQAGNFPVLLIDGVVSGVWHQKRSGKKIAITVEPLRELTACQRREIDERVERIGAIMEGSATWESGTVSVGPHA